MEWTSLQTPYVLIALTVTLLFVITLIAWKLWLANKHKQRNLLTLDIAIESAIGTQEIQTDAAGLLEKPWGTLAMLADGTGKENAGKLAALTIVQTFLQLFADHDVTGNPGYFFTQAFNRSNKTILDRLRGARGGTAAAAVLIKYGYLNYAGVGNIKIAILRDKKLVPLNAGHTMKTAAAKGFAQGRLTREQALAASKIDRQTNYVGRDGFKNIELAPEPIRLNPLDTIIIMNAGLNNSLSWVELEAALAQPGRCQPLADQIIQAFNRKRLPDKANASLIVLRYYGA